MRFVFVWAAITKIKRFLEVSRIYIFVVHPSAFQNMTGIRFYEATLTLFAVVKELAGIVVAIGPNHPSKTVHLVL